MKEIRKNFLEEIEKWNQELIVKSQKEKKKNQYREWGKLGGRPQKGKDKLSEKMMLSLTVEQKRKLDLLSKSFGIKPQELLRNLISNTEPRDPERNKILLEYRTNFKRISNHFKSGVWTLSEKKKFTSELNAVILLIENNLKSKQ
ncbi:MAG: hypothetical protein ACR2MS_12960 [Weeksellaceae bacterium]